MCRSVEEVAEKFHAGDVLVVPYTTNELLPIFRQAAAVKLGIARVEEDNVAVVGAYRWG